MPGIIATHLELITGWAPALSPGGISFPQRPGSLGVAVPRHRPAGSRARQRPWSAASREHWAEKPWGPFRALTSLCTSPARGRGHCCAAGTSCPEFLASPVSKYLGAFGQCQVLAPGAASHASVGHGIPLPGFPWHGGRLHFLSYPMQCCWALPISDCVPPHEWRRFSEGGEQGGGSSLSAACPVL